MQKPRLILALGRFVTEFIAPLSPDDLAEWRKWRKWSGLDVSGPVKRVHFDFDDTGDYTTTVVALVHPSMRRSNLRWRRYRGRTGNEAELAMLKMLLVVDALRYSRGALEQSATPLQHGGGLGVLILLLLEADLQAGSTASMSRSEVVSTA